MSQGRRVRIRAGRREVRGPAGRPGVRVFPALNTAAAYSWRLLVVGAVVYAVFATLGRFHEIAVAVFLGLVGTAMLHPLVMSWAVRLHPVVVALTVIGGAIAAGVIGAVVAVPLVSVLWSIYQALRATE